MSGSTSVGARGIWRWWPLRFVVFFIILLGAHIGCQLVSFLLPKQFPALSKPEALILGAAINVVVVIALYRLLVRWTERRVADELLLRSAFPSIVGGALLGILLFVAVFACLYSYGVASVPGIGTTEGVAGMIALAAISGVGEEIVFRGAVFRLLEEGFGTTIAILLSGALFGLGHAFNQGATLMSTASIAIEAGVLLAAAYALTRSLWLPIGLHFGWNFTEGGIFGAAVSGHTAKGLLNVSLHGSNILTGGQFGPEASVIAVGVSLVASVAMLTLAVRRGNWRPMQFRFRTGAG